MHRASISIHALLAESDGGAGNRSADYIRFLSTLSLRRATAEVWQKVEDAKISIHALLAESDARAWEACASEAISIHALLAESDRPDTQDEDWIKEFLSTLSLRRATRPSAVCWTWMHYFYPRSPCGERLKQCILLRQAKIFLSTLSLRRATISANNHVRIREYFYPRSPCGERPLRVTSSTRSQPNFYPRSPCGERRAPRITPAASRRISIHALLAESDYGQEVK